MHAGAVATTKRDSGGSCARSLFGIECRRLGCSKCCATFWTLAKGDACTRQPFQTSLLALSLGAILLISALVEAAHCSCCTLRLMTWPSLQVTYGGALQMFFLGVLSIYLVCLCIVRLGFGSTAGRHDFQSVRMKVCADASMCLHRHD